MDGWFRRFLEDEVIPKQFLASFVVISLMDAIFESEDIFGSSLQEKSVLTLSSPKLKPFSYLEENTKKSNYYENSKSIFLPTVLIFLVHGLPHIHIHHSESIL